MNKRNMHNKTLIALSMLLPALIVANAARADTVELISVVEKEVVTTTADGEIVREIVPAETVIPGEEVIYTTRFKNVGTQAANSIVSTNPVPENMRYKADSAAGADTEITFSVDEGESYAAPEALQVTGRNGKPRAARASDYTHIRWAYRPSLPAGEESSVQFRAVLQ
ncbi:MAG: hypothetical protein ACREVE_13345 [Gammaproteobacteria bacterium]